MLFEKPAYMQLFIVEGNIGAGKSTFLRILSSALNVNIIYEPHERWQCIGNSENLLAKFYADPIRWAYTFQSYAFITRIMEVEYALAKSTMTHHILERSVYSDRYCFAKNAFELGYMTSLEWKLYQEWFSWLVDSYMVKPDGFIYLRTDPQVCYQRMKKRNRSEELLVALDYLQLVHEKHEQWLLDKKELSPTVVDIPVLVLDCNSDFEHDKAQQESHIQKINEFFGIQLNNNKKQQPTVKLS